MDDLRKKTDKELQKMEKKLAKIYKEAEKDLTKKWNEYMERAEKRIEKYEKALSDAKQSGDKESIAQAEEELKRRREAVLHKDEWYRKMVEQTAEKYSDVNNIAVAYVNDKMPGIYTMNLNGTLQDIESDLGKVGQLGVSFNLVDEHTVRNLVKSDKSLFPQKVINKAKDMKWNLKAINSQVTQGILQGESIPQIQKRLQNVTSMNSAAAIRSARTMCTTAENNGRLSGIKEAEEQGIVYEKQWMATHDDRTRESHAELDGVSVPIDDEFPNGLQYPGDPAGDPEEVYNCFVGETKIGANSRVVRTYKHKYEGDLFTIKTASGIQFTCTPNHPILTSRGWIAANRINDGDDLFVTSVSKKPFFVTWSNPNINHVLARFDTIHKFFKVFGRKRTADLGVNFHGDIPTSDVEIITQKRLLRKSRNSCRRKSINKFFFILADKAAFCKSTFFEHFGRIWQSSFCNIGSKGKSFSFFGRCLRHSKIHSLRPIALLDSGRIQKSYNNGARYAQLLGNSLNGFSGIVFADKVISIDIKFSHCDVFNLQSENGYYFAGSIIPQRHRKGNNDIMVIVHNCRCSMVRKLIGFRRKDGSVSEVGDINSYEPHYFPKAEPEEKTETAEASEFFKPLGDDTYENPFPEASRESDAELTRFIFNEKKDIPKDVMENATNNEKLELSQLKSTQSSIDAESIKSMMDMSVDELKELNENSLPVVYKVNGDYIIDDGNHRLSVMMAKGEETVEAKVIDVDKIREQEEKIVPEDIDINSLSMDVKFDYLYTKEQGYTQNELYKEYEKFKDVQYNPTPEERYKLAKEMTKEVPTEDNFFKNSVGFWKKVDDREEKPNHISYNKRTGNISSEYWYSEEGVYRRSDHWGSNVASCSWYIEGREYGKYDVELGERETAFIPWSDLKAKGVIHYDEGIYTLNEYEHNFTFS